MQTFRTTQRVDFDPSQACFDAALDHALRGRRLDRNDVVALFSHAGERLGELLRAASRLREEGHGTTITYSAKVFVPLIRLCRDECRYCAFRRNPEEAEARTLEPDEVVALARAGARLGAKEALVSLGDRPETRFPEHRGWLAHRGHLSTIEYVAAVCRRVLDETPLLPHANCGVMDEAELARLRPVCGSMGLMLESTSDRLLMPGGPHEHAPDKAPARRLATLEAAGRLRIPFTTGILIGIGERLEDRADSLLVLRDLHDRYGHIQEVIIQSFRAKPDTPMQGAPEPTFGELQATLAIARLTLGPQMNLQAPPNLSPDRYPELIRAGLNDWGGISPLTIDHINPEAPWPVLKSLRDATASMGCELRERLTVYPEYLVGRPAYVHEALRARMLDGVDGEGLVAPSREAARWN
jgi:7,8-didemethyl-8-hydroxy-5-deazariboflavin synthase CofG subunit